MYLNRRNVRKKRYSRIIVVMIISLIMTVSSVLPALAYDMSSSVDATTSATRNVNPSVPSVGNDGDSSDSENPSGGSEVSDDDDKSTDSGYTDSENSSSDTDAGSTSSPSTDDSTSGNGGSDSSSNQEQNQGNVESKESEAADDKSNGEYIVSYLNTNGIVEMTANYNEGDSVNLNRYLGGGEDQLGWSLTEGGDMLTSYIMPAKDITLYPVLDESKTTYAIKFMKENSDGDYELADTVIVTAAKGDEVSANSVQNSENAKAYDFYDYDSSSSSSTQTVADDGSTVVEVRFNRKEYTLKFDINGNYRSVSDLYYASLKMNIGGTDYAGSGYSFTAKYGDDISNKFPTKDNVVDNQYLATKYSDYFAGWKLSSGNIIESAGSLDGNLLYAADANGVISLSGNWKGSTSSDGAPIVTLKYHIYHQNEDDNEYTFYKTVEKSAVASAITQVSIDGYEGFHYINSESVGEKKTVNYGYWWAPTTVEYYEETNVYFDRNEYTISFKINSETVKSDSVRYGASLESYRSYEPSKPSTRAYLDGWYAEDGALYDFSDTMPASDIELTGTWKYGELTTKTLSYDANGGEGPVDPRIVGQGSTVRVNDGSSLSREGYTFTGWNTEADGSGNSYAPSSKFVVNEDSILYAQWELVQSPDETNSNDTVDPIGTDSTEDADSADDNDDPASNASNESDSPKTSDNSNLSLWLAILIAAIIGTASMITRRKTR